MSYYTHLCLRCPTKHFVKPGTENDATPRHEGIGYEFDGSQVKDGERLDGIHVPLPEPIRSRRAQMWMLACAYELIKVRVPVARYVELETSDQDTYGFVVTALRSAPDGPNLLPSWDDTQHPLLSFVDDINDQVSDLEWDGVVGEDQGGYVTVDMETNKVVHA